MYRRCGIIFCGNEHGTGDVTFPDVSMMSASELMARFIEPPTESVTRKAAKAEGWGRVNGEDYCPTCIECGI